MHTASYRGHEYTIGDPPSGWGRGWRRLTIPSLGIARDVFGDERDAMEQAERLVDLYDPVTATGCQRRMEFDVEEGESGG